MATQMYYEFDNLTGYEIETLLLYIKNNQASINEIIQGSNITEGEISNLKSSITELEEDLKSSITELEEDLDKGNIKKIDGGSY